MQKTIKLAVLSVASVAFFLGVSGAILFFPQIDANGADGFSARANGKNIVWMDSLRKASEIAKSEHKYVLVDIYTDWCGWCKRLDSNVFSNGTLAGYLQKDFVCVKLNAEDSHEGTAVATSYKVNGYPCGLVFAPDGKLAGKISGYEEAPDYIHTLRDIVSGTNKGN